MLRKFTIWLMMMVIISWSCRDMCYKNPKPKKKRQREKPKKEKKKEADNKEKPIIESQKP